MTEREPGDLPAVAPDEPRQLPEEPIEEGADSVVTVEARPVSDTLGTGSGCAVGCTVVVLAIIAIAIILWVIAH